MATSAPGRRLRYKRDDGLLWRRLANRAVLRPSADNGFVNLDNLVCTTKRAGGG
jgi:hypothetical protein